MEYVIVLLLILGGFLVVSGILYAGQKMLKVTSVANKDISELVRMDKTSVSPQPSLQDANVENGILFLTGAESQAMWNYAFVSGKEQLAVTMDVTMNNTTFDQVLFRIGGDTGISVIMTHNVHKGHYNIVLQSPEHDYPNDEEHGSFHIDDNPNFSLTIQMVSFNDTDYRCTASVGTHSAFWNVRKEGLLGEFIVHTVVKHGYVRLDNVLVTASLPV